MFNSIQLRLIAGLIPLIAFFSVLAAAVWHETRVTASDISTTVKRNTLANAELETVAILVQQLRRYEKEFFIYVADEEGREKYIKEWSGAQTQLAGQLTRMSKNADNAYSDADKAIFAKATAAASFYHDEMNKIFKLVETRAFEVKHYEAPTPGARSIALKSGIELPPAPLMHTPTEINGLIKAGKDRLSAELIKPISTLATTKTKETLQLPAISDAGFQRLARYVLILCATGIAVALIIMFALPRAIKRPIAALSRQIDAVSKGAAYETSAEAGIKEFATLSQAVERMARAQKMLLDRVKRSAS